MKNKEKTFLMRLVSIIVGIILWVLLIYIEDASFETTLKGIPIEFSGESSLIGNGLMVVDKDSIEDTAVSVRGKRSDIINSMDGISAVIDLSKISVPGTYNMKISYEIETNAVYITEKKNVTAEITVEKIQTREFDAETVTEGIPFGDKIIEAYSSEQKVTVSGSAEDIAKIDHVAIFADVTNITKKTNVKCRAEAVDKENGKIRFTNDIYISPDECDVSVIPHKKILLPVKIDLQDPDGKCILKTESVSEKEIYVGADENTGVTEIRALIVYDEKNTEYTAELQAPDGIYIPEDKKKVTVKIKASPIGEQYVSVPLQVKKNDSQSYSAPEEVTLRVRGAAEDLTASNITAEIDITGFEKGFHSAEIKATFKEETMSLAEKQTVAVTVE